MQKARFLVLCGLLIVALALLAYSEAGAVANGDGSCSSAEEAGLDCASFSPLSAIIEFLGTTPTTCTVGAGPVKCTEYKYQYTGSSTNQINVAIPKDVMTKFTSGDKTVAGCSQLITDGSGDSTTNFGINLSTHNVCRVAITGTALSKPFSIRVDPSSPLPGSWQVRQSSTQVAADLLLGPGTPAAPVAETAATLTTSEGTTISYTNVNGQITVTSGDAATVPISDTKLCIFNGGLDRTFPANWTCETIAFATDQCDIKTTGGDPCRFVGGSCISY
ncbi:MAG TPA: hypothetical protein VNN77_03020 [candidate division Zixibacteria bacterium]|nr:hypothetical protein [candidate division Zixibacteria bacterium]